MAENLLPPRPVNAAMDDRAELILRCAHCQGECARSLRWVQENNFFVCPQCGTSELIDKDAATLRLATLEPLVG